jgi:hypothetical protein
MRTLASLLIGLTTLGIPMSTRATVTLTMSFDKAEYEVGETISVTVTGVADDGENDYYVNGVIEYNPALVSFNSDATQSQLTTLDGGILWILRPLSHILPNKATSFNQEAPIPPPLAYIDDPLVATMSFQAQAPGIAKFNWVADGGPGTLHFFGLANVPGGTVMIGNPHPADVELTFEFGSLAPLSIESQGVVGVGVSGVDLTDLRSPALDTATASGTTSAGLAVFAGLDPGTFTGATSGNIGGAARVSGGLSTADTSFGFDFLTATLGVGGTNLNTVTLSTPSGTTSGTRVIQFAPFSTGAATLQSGTANSTPTSIPTVMATGFVHGPLSATSTAGQAGGVLQLISPTQVTTSPILSPTPVRKTALFTRLTVTIPEPGMFATLVSGMALLALLGWRRSRRRG